MRNPSAAWFVVVLTLWVSTAAIAHAQDTQAPTTRGLIREVTLVCDAAGCPAPPVDGWLLEMANLGVGTPWDANRAAAAAERLLATNWFASLEVEADTVADGVAVRFVATPAILIRRVGVRAGLGLGSEIRRRVFLRSGQPWTDDTDRIERQGDTIRDYFESDGYFGSRVRLRVEEAGPGLVDLDLRVVRGSRRTVGNLYLRGHEAMSYDAAREILLGEFNLLRTFTTARFSQAQDALLAEYRARGYIQARLAFDDTRTRDGQNTADLFVQVREGPRWQVVFVGNTVFGADALRDGLSFWQTGFVDDAELQVAAEEIRLRYENAGYFFAQVDVAQQETPEGQRVVFTIREGDIAVVRSVRFEGVRALDTAVLSENLATTVYDVFSVGGYLQRDALAADVATITAAARAQGFARATVTRVVVVADPLRGTLDVAFHLDEGVRTTVSAATAEVLAASDGTVPSVVLPRLGVRPGAAYNPSSVREDEALISGALRRLGHPFAVTAARCALADDTPVSCEPPPPDSTCVGTLRGPESACVRVFRAGRLIEECPLRRDIAGCQQAVWPVGETIQVQYVATPAGTARFGRLFLRGNFRTQDSILRTELGFEAGDVFDHEALLLGQSNVRSLGIFDSVRVRAIYREPDDAAVNVADVVVQFEEAPSRFLEHRVGLEGRLTNTRDLLLVLANAPSYRDLNFLGRAEELRLVGNFDFDVQEPSRVRDQEFRAGVAAIYLDPRFRLWGALNDPFQLRSELRWTYDLLAIAPAPLRQVWSAETRVREEFDAVRGLSLEGALGVRFSRSRDQSNPALLEAPFEDALVLSLAPRVSWDRRDNPLNPTRGTFHQFELEFADDFGGFDAARFTRAETRHSGFVPIGDRLVLGMNIRMGAAFGGISQGFVSTGVYALPLAERFSLGGVTTLRGFDDAAVEVSDATAFGGDAVVNASVELRYPLTRFGLQGALFADVGQLGRDLPDLFQSRVRSSAGMGFRFLIADLIPLLLDYGVVLDRRPGEPFGRLHFNVGYTF